MSQSLAPTRNFPSTHRYLLRSLRSKRINAKVAKPSPAQPSKALSSSPSFLSISTLFFSLLLTNTASPKASLNGILPPYQPHPTPPSSKTNPRSKRTKRNETIQPNIERTNEHTSSTPSKAELSLRCLDPPLHETRLPRRGIQGPRCAS